MALQLKAGLKINLSTSSLTIPSFQGDPQFFHTSSLTIPSFQGDPQFFHKGIFLKQAPHIK